MDAAIRLSGVKKTFGAMTALHGLDLEIPRGALYGFIGPNGAGKTTTIRLIMAILFPDSGTVSVLGRASALDAKDRIGYLPEERGVYRKMRVADFLRFLGKLKGVTDPALSERIARGIERVGLAGNERKRCEELSKGMQQKVQFLAAVLHEPDLLILDEPFSGLDPVSAQTLRELVIEEHRRGATVLFSTHVMPHAEELCDHVVMIHKGRKMIDDPVAAIRRRFDPRAIHFDPFDPSADLAPLRLLPEVESVTAGGGTWVVRLRDGADPSAAISRLAAVVPPARVEIARPRLEDIFIQIVTGSASSEAADDLRAGLRTAPTGVAV
jgi:ABC-2 type transport system ATP-binding protein